MAHHTRKHNVFYMVATAGTIGVLGLGLAPAGSKILGTTAGDNGIEHAISLIAVNVAGAAIRHKYNKDLKVKGEYMLMKEHLRFCVCGKANHIEANFCS
jgi:hypothetical protein